MQITEQQARAISRGELKIAGDALVPVAQARPVNGGLLMTERTDDSGRPIRTFVNSGSRKEWMDVYRGEVYVQTVMSRDVAWNRRVHQERLASMGITS